MIPIYASGSSDPDFPQKARFIIVEFGNSLYQPMLDRYINGEDVPLSEVQQVWRNTTVTETWDSPVYAEFYAAVREVNRKLPEKGRLRVIAGDPPIDWSKVKTNRDIHDFLDLRGFPSSLNRVPVTSGDKALVIYGLGHLKRPAFPRWAAAVGSTAEKPNAMPAPSARIARALRVSDPQHVFVVGTLAGPSPSENLLAAPTRPVLVSLIGTPAGTAHSGGGVTYGQMLGDQMDALVYFGNTADADITVPPDPDLSRYEVWS